MGIMDKFLNPLGDKKPGAYQDISKDSQRVASAPPSELLLYCRDLAGVQIQRNMNLLNDCRWVRQEYTYPAFDSMNFVYKNQIFSVVIDILDTKIDSEQDFAETFPDIPIIGIIPNIEEL